MVLHYGYGIFYLAPPLPVDIYVISSLITHLYFILVLLIFTFYSLIQQGLILTFDLSILTSFFPSSKILVSFVKPVGTDTSIAREDISLEKKADWLSAKKNSQVHMYLSHH